MSTMRYIGARYVPKWYVNSVNQSSDWEVNVEYEPLTWVTTQNNHLYLSKKTVPDNIGSPAQNTDYWLDMGEMTGDLQNIQDQIDGIVTNMGNLSDLTTTDKSNLVAAINEAAGSGGGSSEDPIHDYYWLIIGDSYTMLPDDANNWAAKLVLYMGLSSSEYTIVKKDGGGFGNGLFLQAVNETTITSTKPIKIVVCGGFNDATYLLTNTYTDLLSALSGFSTAAYTRFNVSKIYCGFIAYENWQIMGQRGNNEAMSYALHAYRFCMRYKMQYLNNVEYALRDCALLDSSGFHPNIDGSRYIADAVYSAILGGSATGYNNVKEYHDVATYPTGAVYRRGAIYESAQNEIFTLLVKDLYIDSISVTPTHGAFVLFNLPVDKGLLFGSRRMRTSGYIKYVQNGAVVEDFCVFQFNQNVLTCLITNLQSNLPITGFVVDLQITLSSDSAWLDNGFTL